MQKPSDWLGNMMLTSTSAWSMSRSRTAGSQLQAGSMTWPRCVPAGLRSGAPVARQTARTRVDEAVAHERRLGSVEERHDNDVVRDVLEDLAQHLQSLRLRDRGEVAIKERVKLGVDVAAAVARAVKVIRWERGFRAV